MREVVITGMGVVSPIGLSVEQFWASLLEGRSGVGRLEELGGTNLRAQLGARVGDFEPRKYVKPRKNIKMMSRDIQMGYVAAELAWTDTDMADGSVDPERLGVIFGADLITINLADMVNTYRSCIVDGRFDFSRWGTAMTKLFPLWMLKYLPNMPACHIGIGRDARGPNDSLTLGRVSGLAAMAEAVRVIERGQADVMITGGTSSRLAPLIWARQESYELSGRLDDPAAACRPFAVDRDGTVHGEGAAAFVLETRRHAENRGAKVLARVCGFSNAFAARSPGGGPKQEVIARAIRGSLDAARMEPHDIGHVNADGLGMVEADRIEAAAIHQTLNTVPVTAPKSYFGNLFAATGAVEAVASLVGLGKGLVPPTLNHVRTAPECPVNVVHGEPLAGTRPTALLLNQSRAGGSTAIIVSGP